MLADIHGGLVDASAHGAKHYGLQLIRVTAGVGDRINPRSRKLLDAPADDLVIAERAAGYAQMPLIEKPAQLFLYSNR